MVDEVRIVQLRLENAQAIRAAQQYTKALQGIATETGDVAIANQRLKQSSAGLGQTIGGRRGLAGFAQQASFQISDLAIVLDQGTGAARAFGVQLGQLVAFMPGMVASVAALALTVGGVLLQSWLDSEGAVKDLDEALKNLNESFDSLEGLETIRSNLNGLNQEYRSLLLVLDQVSQREKQRAIEATLDQVGLNDALRDYIAAANIAAQTQVTPPEFEFLGLTLKQAADLRRDLNALQFVSREQAAEELNLVTQRLEAQLALTDEVQNLIDQVARELGILDQIDEVAKEAAASTEAQARAVEESAAAFAALYDEIDVINAEQEEYNQRLVYMNSLLNQARGYWQFITDRAREAASLVPALQPGDLQFGDPESYPGADESQSFADKFTWAPVVEEIERARDALDDTTRAAGSAGTAISDAAREAEQAAERAAREQEALVEQMTLTWQELAESGIDGFVDALFDADKSFKDFARDFLIQIGKMIAKQILFNALVAAFGGRNGVPFPGFPNDLITPTRFAKGGIVNRPALFPLTRGSMGLMGEAGPEAIMPLQRGSDGRLGVSGPSISINNYTNADVSITRTDEDIIEIAVREARRSVASEFSKSMHTGQGVYARSLEQGYSARRRTG